MGRRCQDRSLRLNAKTPELFVKLWQLRLVQLQEWYWGTTGSTPTLLRMSPCSDLSLAPEYRLVFSVSENNSSLYIHGREISRYLSRYVAGHGSFRRSSSVLQAGDGNDFK